MKFPDRPVVTAGLGVAFALVILVALSTPVFFQPPTQNSADVAATRSSVMIMSTTAASTQSPSYYAAPNITSSSVANSIGTASAPEALSTASITTSTATNSFVIAETTVTSAISVSSSQNSTLVPYSGPNSQFGTESSAAVSGTSPLYIFASKLSVIGVIALVLALAAALVMYRRINSS